MRSVGAVSIRVHGHPADVAAALTVLLASFPDAAVSRTYRDRAGGRVRIYLTTPPNPDATASRSRTEKP